MKAKYKTAITEANGGNHCPKQTKQSWLWLDQCIAVYKYPRLYHLVITADEKLTAYAGNADYQVQKAILKDVMRRLRRKGIRCSYRACRELADQEKSAHIHAFICCESNKMNPDLVLNESKGGWLQTYARDVGAHVHISVPQNDMHDRLPYMTLTPPRCAQLDGELTPADEAKVRRIEDAKVWISYLTKRRTKPDSGEVYTSSRTL